LGIALAAHFMRQADAPHSALRWLCEQASEEWINT
jgi:hypothetical protein